MEVVESSLVLDCSKRKRQSLISCKKKAEIVSNNTAFVEVTNKDLLHMFEHNEDTLQYYLSLKEAAIESRRQGEACWCDPRDVQMKERLVMSGWKPKVVSKWVPGQQDNSEPGGVKYSSKQVALDDDDQVKIGEDVADADAWQEASDDDNVMKKEPDNGSFVCGLGGCKQTFTSLAGHESHYHTFHNYVCSMCRCSFVSAFLLDVHLEENHDSYFQILSSRIDMFRCLVESCSLKFKTPDLRKDHLVKEHKLPANFMFHKPIKMQSKKMKAKARPQSVTSCTESSSMDTSSSSLSVVTASSSSSSEPSTIDCEAGEPSLSNVGTAENSRKGKMVPRTISFGRRSQKAFSGHRLAGRGRHWHQVGAADMATAVDIEKVDFTDMVDSLECA